MIMGNLMAIPAANTNCMAARTPPGHSVDERADNQPVGIAHLTVIPTNFDPAAPGNRRD